MRRRVAFVMSLLLAFAGCAADTVNEASRKWDAWIGSSKDERVRDLGIPTRCHAFKDGGEVCEWQVRWAPDTTDTLALTFDSRGTVCQWTVRSVYGDRRSQGSC